MGNLLRVCCGGQEEAKRPGALRSGPGSGDDGFEDVEATYPPSSPQYPPHLAASPDPADPTSAKGGEGGGGSPAAAAAAAGAPSGQEAWMRAEAERQRALREEQARLELIVSAAGRDMVPVAGQRGPTEGGGGGASFDPAYAAAVAAELVGLHGDLGPLSDPALGGQVDEVLARSPVRGRMPRSALPAGDPAAVVDALLGARWDGIELGKRGGAGGCGGEDPNYVFDDTAEQFLDSVVPTRSKLFQSIGPIVENLP